MSATNIFLTLQKLDNSGKIVKEVKFPLSWSFQANGENLIYDACVCLGWDFGKVKIVNFRKENTDFDEIDDILPPFNRHQVKDMDKYYLQVFVEENGETMVILVYPC